MPDDYPTSDRQLSVTFLSELAYEFHEDGLIDVIGPTLTGISDKILSMKFNENYRPVIRVLPTLAALTQQAMMLLAQIKPIASIMPQLSNWIPAQHDSGTIIERSSFFGPFFALSPLDSDVSQAFFKDLRSTSAGDKQFIPSPIQEALRQYQTYLFEICLGIIKSGDCGRRGVLNWFSNAISQNKTRKAVQVDPAAVASDGFMCNLVGVLNRLAAPFVEKNLVRAAT
jgi:ubiquitin conjugation factor E4 B